MTASGSSDAACEADAQTLRPADEAELAEAVRAATGPLRIVGGGTRPVGPETGARPLSTCGLRGITLYEPGALTVVARAGTPLAELEETLATEGQRLPFEPMDHRGLMGTTGTPTLGGMVAANVSGPRRIQAGACRDSLIGVRFVDGAGTVTANGGRVMKNVTGYDLARLMAGSFGTLGILSEVAFKLLPAPETQATLRIDGLSAERAVAALSAGLCSPFEVSGAAHVTGAEPRTLMRLEGFADAVRDRAARLAAQLGRFGPVSVEDDPARSAAIWRELRDVAPFHGRDGDVWRLSVKPSDGPALAARAGGEALFDWGGGLVWLLLPPGTDLRARLGAFAGHATLLRADAETRARLPVFQPEPAALAALTDGLRRRFDPRGILNPGLMA